MTTITVNERTKAGKIVLELAKMLSATNKGGRMDSKLNVLALIPDSKN